MLSLKSPLLHLHSPSCVNTHIRAAKFPSTHILRVLMDCSGLLLVVLLIMLDCDDLLLGVTASTHVLHVMMACSGLLLGILLVMLDCADLQLGATSSVTDIQSAKLSLAP
jgi:hypothetical protein